MLDGEEYFVSPEDQDKSKKNKRNEIDNMANMVSDSVEEINTEESNTYDPFGLLKIKEINKISQDNRSYYVDSEVLQTNEKHIKEVFDSNTIPEYNELNLFALHSTFLQYVDALEIIRQNGQNKNTMNGFKIAKELFDKDLEAIKKSQAIEKRMYYNLSKSIREILQDSVDEIFNIIRRNVTLSEIDKKAYLNIWDSTREKIFTQLKEQILKQKSEGDKIIKKAEDK